MAVYKPIMSADDIVPEGIKGYSYYGIDAALEYFEQYSEDIGKNISITPGDFRYMVSEYDDIKTVLEEYDGGEELYRALKKGEIDMEEVMNELQDNSDGAYFIELENGHILAVTLDAITVID